MASIHEEITQLGNDITLLEAEINQPALCDKLREYVYLSDNRIKTDDGENRCHEHVA